MTQLLRLTLAAVLVVLVTMSAFAGEIPIPGAIAPPPPPSAMTAPGEIQIGVTNINDSSDYMLEGLQFRLLQTLLTLY